MQVMKRFRITYCHKFVLTESRKKQTFITHLKHLNAVNRNDMSNKKYNTVIFHEQHQHSCISTIAHHIRRQTRSAWRASCKLAITSPCDARGSIARFI